MTTRAPAILPGSLQQWRAARRELITASDAAAILGVDPHRGPLAVYAEKVGGVETEETLPMARGRRFEEVIAQEYVEQTRRAVIAQRKWEISIHPDVPWLGATLDRVVASASGAPDPLGDPASEGPLQIKMALGSAAEWKEDPPLGYVIQVQVEIACFRARWGALCALVGAGPLKTHDLKRDDDFMSAALPKLEAFRWAVEHRVPPPADALAGTTSAIRRLWPRDDGETVALTREDLPVVREWERAREREAEAEKAAQLGDNKLRARLGTAAFGALPDGSYLSLKTVEREGYLVQPTRYRTLKRFWPKLLTR